MGVLIAKCPGTGKEFSTGINADRNSLVGLRAILATSICPHCGAEHAWRVQDARYVDAGGEGRVGCVVDVGLGGSVRA
jgi:predicted RNA-binding Zn-ribbon protein involved in translation (DUF1610 family)